MICELFDVNVSGLAEAGLNKVCVVRVKSFTLDNGLLFERCGRLGARDISQVTHALKKVFSLD